MKVAKVSGRLLSLLVCSVALTSCGQRRDVQQPDTVAVHPSPSSSATTPDSTNNGWDERAGTFFIVPGSSAESALVIYPEYSSDQSIEAAHFDIRRAANASVELTRDGETLGSARLTNVVVDQVEDCSAWPRAQVVSNGPGQSIPTDWSVGLASSVRRFPLAQLAHMSEKDSVRFVIALARLASGIADDTSTVFRGRPFVVRQVTMVRADSLPFLFGEVIRSIDQEAMPLQEHLTILAEPDATQVGGYRVAYFERSTGSEETVETTELLAAFAPDGVTLQLLVSRELGEGVAYAVFSRDAGRSWHVRWTSAYAGC